MTHELRNFQVPAATEKGTGTGIICVTFTRNRDSETIPSVKKYG